MKLFTFIGNLVLWMLVAALLLLGIAAAIQPYRVSRMFQNIVALAGPSMSQATPFEGTLVRLPLKVEGCADVPWVKTLVSANAISVDGLCNVKVLPELSHHVLTIKNGQIYTGPADCRDIANSDFPFKVPARGGYFCVFSSYLKRSEDFGAAGDGKTARASVWYVFSDMTPFAKVDKRLVYSSNPPTSTERVSLSQIAQGGEAHTNDLIELGHFSWFDWRLVKRDFKFVQDVQ